MALKISPSQPFDNDLTAIAALTGTTGLLKKTATDTWSLDTSAYITSSGSITGNAATATALQTARTINGVSFDGTANINIATNLIVLNRSAASVNVAIANALLPIVNRAGSTINVAVS